MRNKRLVVVLAGAVVFGLVAAMSVSRLLSNAQAYTSNLKTVVVAKVDVPLGTKIIPEQLTTVQFPQSATPDGVFDSPERLVGRVAVTNILAREPITDFKLAPEGSTGGLSAVIPEGYRAMTVKVDDVVGVSGFLTPGALVDVVVVINPVDNSSANPISKIVLQNIKVLANGQNLDKPKNEREAETVHAVTLQVMPEQAEKLALASTEGKLRLTLRNATDQSDEPTQGVDKRRLLTGEQAMPAPEPGALKSEQQTQTQASRAQAPMPRAPRPMRMRPLPPIEDEPKRAVASAPAAAAPAATPVAPRASVEMIEAGKKRTIDLH